jgi:hypothetical protein
MIETKELLNQLAGKEPTPEQIEEFERYYQAHAEMVFCASHRLPKVEARNLWRSNRALEAKVNKTNHELIRIAAELVTWKGLPSYYVSEHPARASRQYWQEVMGKIDTRIKDWAIQIKFIVEQSKEKP